MAEPLKIVCRLADLTTDYAVFERDQVLTETQLNSVTEYLDDQARLTRTQLLGVGIVGGLWPTLADGRLTVSAGVGVTSDGDLLRLDRATVFDRWLAYDATAPAYAPFHVDRQMLPLIELLASSDPRPGQPLADLAGELPDKLLLAFMESYENDPDLCTGGNCDNKGKTARNIQRFLLLDRKLARQLDDRPATGSDLAARLPRLRAARVDLGTGSDAKVDISSAEGFALRYRNAAATTFKALAEAVATLAGQLAGVTDLPSPAAWSGYLQQRLEQLATTRAGIQYLHAHGKDLVAVWGALRAALFADDGVLVPAPGLFAKHLLLGPLADPAALRTPALPAPWLGGDGAARQRAGQAMQLFGALLAAFALPSRADVRIVPSRAESAELGERAIPVYYRADATLRRLWHPQRSQRGEVDDTLGYHWQPAPAAADPNDPFARDLGAVDFFRIEGCLGLQADAAEDAVEKLVRQRNLPIAVISALAHNERRWIVRGPKFKKTSLHSLHYLLRQDLAGHLQDNVAYSGWLLDDVKAAGSSIGRPAGGLNSDYVKPLESAQTQLAAARQELVGSSGQPGPLGSRSYKGFTPQNSGYAQRVGNVVAGTTRAKASLGAVTRNDVLSPIDALAAAKSHLWVDWLGDILKKRDDDARERRLLSRLLNEHPGLCHAGGAAPGGTFVLVYDDSGSVIGDLMLPYWIDDNDESDFDEPELTLPDLGVRLPRDLLPIKVVKPFDLALQDFKVAEILPVIKIQENYSAFFEKSLASLGDVLGQSKTPGKAGLGLTTQPATDDRYLAAQLQQVEDTQYQLRDMQAVRDDPKQPAAVREQAAAQVKVLEGRLADSIEGTTRYFALDASEGVRFAADKNAVYATLGAAAAQIGDAATSGRVRSGVFATAQAAQQAGGAAALVGGQLANGALAFK